MIRIAMIALATTLALALAAPAEAGIRRYGTFPIINVPAETTGQDRAAETTDQG